MVKNLLSNARDAGDQLDPWVGKNLLRRKQQPAPVFLPGESHGQRNLAGYSAWGHKVLDRTEHAYTSKENTASFFRSIQGAMTNPVLLE